MLHLDYTQDFEEFLDSLPTLSTQALETFRNSNVGQLNPPLGQPNFSVEEFVSWLVREIAGEVSDIGPKLPNLDTHIVPVELDSQSSTLNTEAIPRQENLTQMIPNPKTCPAAARRYAARKNKVIVKPVSVAHSSDSDDDFEEDLVGDQGRTLMRNMDESEFKNVATYRRSIEKEDRLSSIELNNYSDLTKMMTSMAGVSLTDIKFSEHEAGRKVPPKFLSLTDLTTKSRDIASSPEPAKMVREVVNMQATERHHLDDTKRTKRLEALRKQNELDNFFGMKRQTITPEMRQEFQAIDLRAYANPQAHYRGAKRGFDLADAESGFFEVGHVVGGGLYDQPLDADGSTIITERGKKRKVKSLVKDLLLAK